VIRALAAVALLLFVAFLGAADARANGELMGDFRAFYCAGELAREHAFTYAQQTIAPCESRREPGFFTAQAATTVPAPLPGYAIAFFEPFSLLPFRTAAALWAFLTLACIVAGVVLVAALGWMQFDAAIVLVALLAGAAIVPPGELAGVAFLGLMLLAYGCERDAPAPRIAGMLLLALEPQIALCAYAVLAARSEYWRELFAAVVVLAAGALLAVGPTQTLGYVTGFLPAHVAAELHRAQQYTIGWALAQAGLAASLALWIGRACFAVAIAASFFLGRRSTGALSIAAAAALSLALGPFVHLNHLICALPAALVAGGPFGTLAALLIAFPPTVLFSQVLLIVIVPIAIYWVVRAEDGSARAGAYGALAGVVVIAVLAGVSRRLGFSFVASTAAGNGWAAYVARHDVVSGALIWLVKAPVWMGVAFAAFEAARLAGRLQAGHGRNRRQRGGRTGRASSGIFE
jgi:hypothetical protein